MSTVRQALEAARQALAVDSTQAGTRLAFARAGIRSGDPAVKTQAAEIFAEILDADLERNLRQFDRDVFASPDTVGAGTSAACAGMSADQTGARSWRRRVSAVRLPITMSPPSPKSSAAARCSPRYGSSPASSSSTKTAPRVFSRSTT